MNFPKLFFFALVLINSFITGMILSSLMGAADGQGLAGGAIILGYGILLAVTSIIVSFIIVKESSKNSIKTYNKYLLGIFSIFLILFLYRLFTMGGPEQIAEPIAKPQKNTTKFIE